MTKKQVFKGTTLSAQRVTNNILSVYARADKSFSNDWYMDANRYAHELAALYSVNVATVAGIIAALSPLKSWSENKFIAELFLKTGRAKHTNLFADKARAILAANGNADTITAILKGRKITSFFLNILNPENSVHVTIDRHALSVSLGYNADESTYRGITAKQYAFFVQAYKNAAMAVEISPLLMQSIVWQQWRKEKGITENAVIAPF